MIYATVQNRTKLEINAKSKAFPYGEGGPPKAVDEVRGKTHLRASPTANAVPPPHRGGLRL